MTQVLDEERVERACAEFFGDALWEKFGQTAKSRGRRNIGAAISAYLGETSGWQTIETAPKDGTIVLVCGLGKGGYYVSDAKWDDGCWFLFDLAMDCYGAESSGHTHWQPLPSPPFNVNTGSDSEETPLAK